MKTWTAWTAPRNTWTTLEISVGHSTRSFSFYSGEFSFRNGPLPEIFGILSWTFSLPNSFDSSKFSVQAMPKNSVVVPPLGQFTWPYSMRDVSRLFSLDFSVLMGRFDVVFVFSFALVVVVVRLWLEEKRKSNKSKNHRSTPKEKENFTHQYSDG